MLMAMPGDTLIELGARKELNNDCTLHQRVNTPLTAENEGQISRVSAHWVLDMLCGDI